MNVRMPDGTLVRNVPEGITQADLQGRLDASRQPAENSAPAPNSAPPEPTSALERFKTGLMDPIVGAAQLMEHTGIPGVARKALGIQSDMADVVRAHEAGYVAPEGVDWMRAAGNVANPMGWGGAGEVSLAARAAPRIARVLEAGPTSVFGRAAAQGAVQSATAPVNPDADYWSEKGVQAGLGGISGGVLAKVLPRALSLTPVKPTADARALQEAGVAVTPGQAAGGWANQWEQKAMSLPVVGDVIAAARRRAQGDFQERALEKAVGAERGKGPKTVEAAQAAVSDLYQQVVPKLRPTPEAAFEVLGSVAKAADNPELTAGNRQILEGLYDKLFGPNGERYMQLSGNSLKELDVELGALQRKYRSSVLPSDHTLAEELGNVQAKMREAWRYHLDPADAAKLDAANMAHARMVPIHAAAGASGGAEEKVFPMALRKAIANQEHKGVTRVSEPALLDPATRVLSNTVPDSGTAGRLTLPATILAGTTVPLGAVAGGLGALAGYSRFGVNALTGNSRLQRAMADHLEKFSPAARKAIVAALRAGQAGQGTAPDTGEQP